MLKESVTREVAYCLSRFRRASQSDAQSPARGRRYFAITLCFRRQGTLCRPYLAPGERETKRASDGLRARASYAVTGRFVNTQHLRQTVL
jgi:hypothetical protein